MELTFKKHKDVSGFIEKISKHGLAIDHKIWSQT